MYLIAFIFFKLLIVTFSDNLFIYCGMATCKRTFNTLFNYLILFSVCFSMHFSIHQFIKLLILIINYSNVYIYHL